MCKAMDFMNNMEQRYKNKNALWDTTFILESIHVSIKSLQAYLKDKNPNDLGDLFAYAFFSFKINHVIKLEEEHKLGYENNLKSIVNLYKSFEEHLGRIGKDINVVYNGSQAEELLKEMYTLTKEMWDKEIQKLELEKIIHNLEKEELTVFVENIMGFSSETDHKNLVPYFIKLCA